jgi:hypothetical protein
VAELASFAQMVLVTAAVAAPIVLLARLLAGDESVSLADLAFAAGRPSWPRGVQEEEPAPWRFAPAR